MTSQEAEGWWSPIGDFRHLRYQFFPFFNFPYWYKTATFCLKFFQRYSQISKSHCLLALKYQIFFRFLHQRSGHPTHTTHPTYSSHPIHPVFPSLASSPSHPCHFSHPSHPSHSCEPLSHRLFTLCDVESLQTPTATRFSTDTGFLNLISCLVRSPRRIRQSSSSVSCSIRKFGFQRTFSRGDASITSNQFGGLGQAHTLLLMCRKLPRLRWTLKSRAVRKTRLSLSATKSSIILSRRNIRFCKVIWLINLCKVNKQTTVAITVILRLPSLILISTSSLKWIVTTSPHLWC